MQFLSRATYPSTALTAVRVVIARVTQHLHQCQLGYDAAHKNIVHGSGAGWNAVHFSQHASSSNHIDDEVKVESTVDCQKEDQFRNTADGQVEN